MYQRKLTHLLLLLCCICCVRAGFGQPDSISSETAIIRKAVVQAPVVPFYDTLFYINANIGSFSAEERAISITEKIRMVSKNAGFHRDSITVSVSGNIMEILFKDIVIMGVTPADARAKGKEQLALVREYEKIIGEAITVHEQMNDWRYILIHVSLALLIVVAQYFLIRLINKLFRKISESIEKQKGKMIKSIKIKSLSLMDEERTIKLILSGINILRYVTVGFLIYLSLPLIFSVFPPTRGIADKLFGYILNPVQKIWISVVGYIPNLFTIIIIIIAFRYLIRMLRYLAGEINKGRLTVKGFYPDWAYPSFNIIRTLLYAFMFIVIFPLLPGSDSRVFQGVSVFIGIIISLGSSSVIGNIVAGLVLTYMRPFRVGDRIKIGDLIGNVVEKTPFVTRIRTPKNEEVTVPNSNIMSAQTFNYSHSAKAHGLILYTDVSFGYDVPWRQVHQLLLEAAGRTPDVMKKPEPFILQTALDDFYAVYQINVYIEEADKMALIYSELNQNIQDAFTEAGIELVASHYAAHRDGNHSVLPANYLPANYKAPLFNVKITNENTEKNNEKQKN